MAFWFKTYRENVDDPQNSMLMEVAQLLLQTRQQQIGSTSPTDLEKKRVSLVTTESYLILVSDGCFVKGKQRYSDVTWKWYVGREPDGSKCRAWYELDYRNNQIFDRALRDNPATLKGYPTIIGYQPEYKPSSLTFNGTTTAIVVPHTANIDNLDDLTITFWVYPTTKNVAGSQYVLSKKYSTANSFICFFNANTWTINWSVLNASSVSSTINSTYINTNGGNRWYKVGIRFKRSTGDMSLWIDGESRATGNRSGVTQNALGGTSDLLIQSTNKWGGNMDDIKMWRRVLTDAEMVDDYNGVEVSTNGLVANWHFDEDEDVTKAFDSIGYNTGNITAGVYSNVIVPALYKDIPFPYEDGLLDQLTGYKTDGSQYLVIPELDDDFRITNKATGGTYYYFVAKFTTFDKFNDGFMRLLQKADDLTLTNFQSFQIRSDGKLYFCCKFNGVEKKVRTVSPLKLLKLYFIEAGIDFDSVAGGNALNIFKIYLNGFVAPIEVTTDTSEFPAVTDIKDRHTYIMRGNEDLKGSFVGQMFAFRYYNEDITAANALGLMTNKFTTYNIDRGHVARSNLTKLPEILKQRVVKFDVPLSVITDHFTYTITDLVLTGRYTSPPGAIPISDDFDYSLTAPSPTLGNYAIDIINTSNVHSWAELDPIDPVKDHFSFFVWLKYRGKVGNWGGIVSAIDGLDNGNRLLTDGTTLRYQGQFDKESNKWEDLRVTIANITGAYHFVGFTHDGDKKKFTFFVDGQPQKTFKIKGDIRGTDKSKTFLGKGSKNGFYLDGLMDDVFIYNRTLSQSDVSKLFLKTSVLKSLWIHYNWERNSKNQIRKEGFNARLVGTVNYSTDHV